VTQMLVETVEYRWCTGTTK